MVWCEPWEIPPANTENNLGSHGHKAGNSRGIRRVHAHQLVLGSISAMAVRSNCPIWHRTCASGRAKVNERKNSEIDSLGDLCDFEAVGYS